MVPVHDLLQARFGDGQSDPQRLAVPLVDSRHPVQAIHSNRVGSAQAHSAAHFDAFASIHFVVIGPTFQHKMPWKAIHRVGWLGEVCDAEQSRQEIWVEMVVRKPLLLVEDPPLYNQVLGLWDVCCTMFVSLAPLELQIQWAQSPGVGVAPYTLQLVRHLLG